MDFLGEINELGQSGEYISSEAKHGLIERFIPTFNDYGYSGAKTLQVFRDAGLGIRDSDFYAIRRRVLGQTIRSDTFKFINLDSTPSESSFIPSREDFGNTYGFRAIFTTRDTDYDEDGNPIKIRGRKSFFYTTDHYGTRREIEDDIRDSLIKAYPVLAHYVEEVKLVAGYINE